MALELSQNKMVDVEERTPSSVKKFCSLIILDIVVANALYFAFVDDRATIDYFLATQEIGVDPRKTQYQIVVFRST